jgi:hypothetical protein
LRCGSLRRAVLRHHGERRERISPIGFDHGPAMPLTDERLKTSADRSGTNPDDRNRNRDAQTKRAENRRDEFGKQTYVLSYAR